MSGFSRSSDGTGPAQAPQRRAPRYSLGTSRSAPRPTSQLGDQRSSSATLTRPSGAAGGTAVAGASSVPEAASPPRPLLLPVTYATFDGAEFCADLSSKIAAALSASKVSNAPYAASVNASLRGSKAPIPRGVGLVGGGTLTTHTQTQTPRAPRNSLAFTNSMRGRTSFGTQAGVQAEQEKEQRELSPDLAGILAAPVTSDKGKARQLDPSHAQGASLSASTSARLSNAEWLARSEAAYAAKLHEEEIAAGLAPRAVEVATQTDAPLIVASQQTQTDAPASVADAGAAIERARLAGRAVEELLGRGGVVPIQPGQKVSLADTFQPVAGEDAGPSNLFTQGLGLEEILRKRAELVEEQMSEESEMDEESEEEEERGEEMGEKRGKKTLIEELRDSPTLDEVLHGNAGIAIPGSDEDEFIGADSASERSDAYGEQDGQYDEDEPMGSEEERVMEGVTREILGDLADPEPMPDGLVREEEYEYYDDDEEEEEYESEEEATPEREEQPRVNNQGGARADEPIELLDSDDDEEPAQPAAQPASYAQPGQSSSAFTSQRFGNPGVQQRQQQQQATWDGRLHDGEGQSRAIAALTAFATRDDVEMIEFEDMDEDDEGPPELNWSLAPAAAPAPAPGQASNANAQQANQVDFAQLYGYDSTQAGLDPALFGDEYEEQHQQPAQQLPAAPPALDSATAAAAYHAPTPPWKAGEDEPVVDEQANNESANALAGFAAYAVSQQQLQPASDAAEPASAAAQRSPSPLPASSGVTHHASLPPGTPGAEVPAPLVEPTSNPVATSAALLAFKHRLEEQPTSTAASVASAHEAGEAQVSTLPLAPGSAGLLAFKRQNPGPTAGSSIAVSVGTEAPAEELASPAAALADETESQTQMPVDASSLLAFKEEAREEAPAPAASLITHHASPPPTTAAAAAPAAPAMAEEAMDTSEDAPPQQSVPPPQHAPMIEDAQDLLAFKQRPNVPAPTMQQRKAASVVSIVDSEEEEVPRVAEAPAPAAAAPSVAAVPSPAAALSSPASPLTEVAERHIASAAAAEASPLEPSAFPIPPPDQPAADAEPTPSGIDDPAQPSDGSELLSFKEQAAEAVSSGAFPSNAAAPEAAAGKEQAAIEVAPAGSVRSLDGSAHREQVHDEADVAAVRSGEELILFKEQVEESAPAPAGAGGEQGGKAVSEKSVDGSVKKGALAKAEAQNEAAEEGQDVEMHEPTQPQQPSEPEQEAQDEPQAQRNVQSSPASVRSGPGSVESAEVDELEEPTAPAEEDEATTQIQSALTSSESREEVRALFEQQLGEVMPSLPERDERETPALEEEEDQEEVEMVEQPLVEEPIVSAASQDDARDLLAPQQHLDAEQAPVELEQSASQHEEHSDAAQSLIAAPSPAFVAEAEAAPLVSARSSTPEIVPAPAPVAAAASAPALRPGHQDEPIELEDSSNEGTPEPPSPAPFVEAPQELEEEGDAKDVEADLIGEAEMQEEKPQIQAEAQEEVVAQRSSPAPTGSLVSSQAQFADADEPSAAEDASDVQQVALSVVEASPGPSAAVEEQEQPVVEEPPSVETEAQDMSIDEDDQPIAEMDEAPDVSMEDAMPFTELEPEPEVEEVASRKSATPASPPRTSLSPVLGKRKAVSPPPAAQVEVSGRMTRRKLKEASLSSSASTSAQQDGTSSTSGASRQTTPPAASTSASAGIAAAVLNAVAPVIPSIFKPASPAPSALSGGSRQGGSTSTSFMTQIAALRRNRHFHQHGAAAPARPASSRSVSSASMSSVAAPHEASRVTFANETDVVPSPAVEMQDAPSPAAEEGELDEDHDEEEGGYEGPATRSRCRYHIVTLPWADSPAGRCVFAVPGCSIAHDKLAVEGATHKGEASEEENELKEWFEPDDLPEELYHAISRIVDPELLGDVAVLPASRPPGLSTWNGEDAETNDMPHVAHGEPADETMHVEVDIPNGQGAPATTTRNAGASSSSLSSPPPAPRTTRATRASSNASSTVPATPARTLRRRAHIAAPELIEESKASQGSSSSSASRRASSRLAGLDVDVNEAAATTPSGRSRGRAAASEREASPATADDDAPMHESASPMTTQDHSASKKRKTPRRSRRSDRLGAEANYLPHTSSSDSEDASGKRLRRKSQHESDDEEAGPSGAGARATSVLDGPDDFSIDVLERAVSAAASDADADVEAAEVNEELESLSPAKPAPKPTRTYKRTRRSGAAADSSFRDHIDEDLPPSEDEDIAERAAVEARKKAAALAKAEEKRAERQAVREEEKEAAALLIPVPETKKRRRTADPAFDPRKVEEAEAEDEEELEEKRQTRKERARRSTSKREKSEIKEDQAAAAVTPPPPESSPRASRLRRRGAA